MKPRLYWVIGHSGTDGAGRAVAVEYIIDAESGRAVLGAASVGVRSDSSDDC